MRSWGGHTGYLEFDDLCESPRTAAISYGTAIAAAAALEVLLRWEHLSSKIICFPISIFGLLDAQWHMQATITLRVRWDDHIILRHF